MEIFYYLEIIKLIEIKLNNQKNIIFIFNLADLINWLSNKRTIIIPANDPGSIPGLDGLYFLIIKIEKN